MENAPISGPLGLSPYTVPASLLHPLASGFPQISGFIVFSFILTLDLLFPLFLILSPHSFFSFYLIKI